MRSIIQFFLIGLCLFVLADSRAQTCSGNFGSPVVKIDFGSGTQPVSVAEFPGYSTNMAFTPGCPDDGAYHISDKIPGCFSSWLGGAPDHTGNTNGRMFIANADDKKNINSFFETTVDGLSAGQAYNFSAWVTTIAKNIFQNPHAPSNVKFVISTPSGKLLKEFSTGDIPALAAGAEALPWQKFGTGFILPQGVTSVRLQLLNNLLGGFGNDLAIDDIMFAPVGPCISITGSCSGAGGFEATGSLNAVTDYDPFSEGNQSYNYATVAYQWQVSTDKGSNWNDIQGANSSNYSTPAIVANSYYRLLVAANAQNLSDANARIVSNTFVIEDCKVLPIVFGKVDAGILGNNLSVNWATMSEMNNDHFDVEISRDGRNFIKAGEVQTKAAGGTSNMKLQYGFTNPFRNTWAMLGLPVFLLLFIGFGKRNRMGMFCLSLFIVATYTVACSRSDAAAGITETKMNVRVAHVDKSGHKTYSETVTVRIPD